MRYGPSPRGLTGTCGQHAAPPRAWLAIATRAALLAALAGLLPQAAAPAGAHGEAHVHGVARLDLGITDGQLTLSLIAPQEALTGFEHRPRTDAQQRTARSAAATLRNAAALFGLPAQAACALSEVQVDDAALSPGGTEEAHPDIEAIYRWQCSRTVALDRVDTSLMTRFPGIRRLDVRVAGRQQRALKLRPPATRIRLAP